MNELEILTEAFNSKTIPAEANAKKFQKLLQKYEHIQNPKIVRFYPIRDCSYDSSLYRVFAMPVNNETIDDATLEAIKEEIFSLPLGSIRFNAAAYGARSLIFEDNTGKYQYKEDDIDDVMSISNHFDGVVIFVTSDSIDNLDTHYAVFGNWDGSGMLKWYGKTVMPITNRALGKPSEISIDTFVENPDVPEGINKGMQQYIQIMQYVMYALIAAGVIWYFFFK